MSTHLCICTRTHTHILVHIPLWGPSINPVTPYVQNTKLLFVLIFSLNIQQLCAHIVLKEV